MTELTAREKQRLLAAGLAVRMFANAVPQLPGDDSPDNRRRCRCCTILEHPIYEPLDDTMLCRECRQDVTILAARYHLSVNEVIELWTTPRACADDPEELSALDRWIIEHCPSAEDGHATSRSEKGRQP